MIDEIEDLIQACANETEEGFDTLVLSEKLKDFKVTVVPDSISEEDFDQILKEEFGDVYDKLDW